MRRTTTVLALALLAGACTPPPDLEDDTIDDTDDGLDNLSLADVIPLLFLDYEADPPRMADLIGVLERELAEQGVDLAGDQKQREFTIDPLPYAEIDVDFPSEALEENQNPIVMFGQSVKDFDTNLATAMETNQVCIESDSTVWYERTYLSTDCAIADFLSGGCDRIKSVNEVHKDLSIAKGWYDVFKDFYRFELSDGRQVLAARSWFEEQFEGYGGGKFYQSFTSEIWIENSAGTADRMYAIWAEIEISVLNDVAIRDLTANSLNAGFERGDSFSDDDDPSDYCSEDRDLENTRAEDEA